MFYYTFRGRVTIVYNRHSSSYTTIYYYLPLPYTLTIYLSLLITFFSKLVWNPLLPLLWVLFYLIFPNSFRTLIMPTFNLLFTIAYTYFFQTRLESFIYLYLFIHVQFNGRVQFIGRFFIDSFAKVLLLFTGKWRLFTIVTSLSYLICTKLIKSLLYPFFALIFSYLYQIDKNPYYIYLWFTFTCF